MWLFYAPDSGPAVGGHLLGDDQRHSGGVVPSCYSQRQLDDHRFAGGCADIWLDRDCGLLHAVQSDVIGDARRRQGEQFVHGLRLGTLGCFGIFGHPDGHAGNRWPGLQDQHGQRDLRGLAPRPAVKALTW